MLKLEVIKFKVEIEGKEYTSTVEDKDFDIALRALIEEAGVFEGESLPDYDKYDKLTEIIKDFINKTFGDNSFSMMTEGFGENYQVAMQIINYIFAKREEYVDTVLKKLEVPKIKTGQKATSPIVNENV